MPTPSKGRIRKCKLNRRKFKQKVYKIFAAAMENVDSEPGPSTSANDPNTEYPSEFYTTGRVGRRNALPDILSSHATVSTADLPDQLSAMSTSDSPNKSTASSSTHDEPTPSTSQMSSTSNS